MDSSFLKETEFVNQFDHVGKKIGVLSREQGFSDPIDMLMYRGLYRKLLHAVSEISEVFECLRDDNPPDKNITEMSSLEVQLSDVLGIIMDINAQYGLDIGTALLKKMEFNKKRGFLHGRKR